MSASPDSAVESKEQQKLQLSPNALDAHNLSSGGEPSREQLVNSWILAQIDHEQQADNEGHVEPPPQRGTPAIVLSNSDQAKAEATVLVPAQKSTQKTSPQHTADMQLQATGLSVLGNTSVEPHGVLGRRHVRTGGRRVSTYPISSFMRRPIMEEDEADEEGGTTSTHREQDKEHAYTQDPPATNEFEVPEILIDAPSENFQSAELALPCAVRKRAQSYPSEAPTHALPLFELPTQQTVHDSTGKPPDSNLATTDSKAQESDVQGSVSRMGKFAQMAIMAKKWKRRSLDVDANDIQQTSTSKLLASRQRNRPLVEVPRTLKLHLLNEAYPMVQRTYQMYMSELGPKHKLTESAKEHLHELATYLGRPTT